MITIEDIKKQSKEVFRMYPVKRVSVFGSFAKGQQTEESDIDMLIRDSDIGILDISNMQQQLSDLFHMKIDLVEEDDLSEVFKFLIKDDEVVIYEK
ncbi:MAG: nucleotidyltransferase domain-containing protein [Lachnospiraceae bacterium]|nr:nucleotidyltransferase domain-containing protein [Lachnospiraceae bacterium]